MYNSRYNVGKIIICDYCGTGFTTKQGVKIHIATQHMVKKEDLNCHICNVIFKTKQTYMRHRVKVHNFKRIKKNSKKKCPHTCYACQINFTRMNELKFHIREFHFNLLTKVPYVHIKKVNQVWFENVANSKNIVEIKKVGENVILIRKLDDNTAMKVGEQETEVLDLRDMYPTKRSLTVQCDICFKLYEKLYINRHKAEVHSK